MNLNRYRLFLPLIILTTTTIINMTFGHGSPFGGPPDVARALEAVKKILEQNKNPMIAGDVDHQYDDKYALVEFMTNTGIAATLNVLEQLDGFNQDVLKQIISVVQDQKRSMTLRLSVEEDCEFIEETIRSVESPTSHQVTVSSPATTTHHVTIGTHQVAVSGTPEAAAAAAGTPTAAAGQEKVFTHKTITQVKEFHWKAGIRHTLMLFAGTDTQHGIVVGTRTGTTKLVTSMNKHPYPPQTRHPLDLDMTWMVNQINKDTLTCSFEINREDAKTPRRNKQTEQCLEFVEKLTVWSHQVAQYFQHTVWTELLRRDNKEPCRPAEWLSKIDDRTVFAPIVPLFQEYTKGKIEEDQASERAGLVSLPAPPSGSPVIPLKDTTLFLKEQCSSLQNALLSVMGNFPDPADQGQLISGYEAKLVLLSLHLASLATSWESGISYVETMLFNQLVSAVGKEVKGEDFDTFLKFHNQRLLGKNYCPKPFCHAIRQPSQYPDGVLSIVAKKTNAANNAKEGDAIETFSRHIPGDSIVAPMQIPLNAATTVDFLGDQYLHGWMDTHFEGEWSPQHFISARARQFSCFLLLVGSISGPDEFTPKDAIILQNKDEVLIPLLTTALPSAKEFRDAIQSLSPEQARFAKSYRSMQLDSSVFGICVVQVKPQMEALLSLPPNALTKEIQLTQDLLSLFVEYQIPPNLVSYDGDDAPVADKVAAVKQHTKGVLDVIKDIKDAQLAEETKKAEMRAEQLRKQKVAQERERGEEEFYMAPSSSGMKRMMKKMNKKSAAVPMGAIGSAACGFSFGSAAAAPAPAPQPFAAPPVEAAAFGAAGQVFGSAAPVPTFEPHSAKVEHQSAEVLQFDDDDGFDDLQDQFDNIDLEKQQKDKESQQNSDKGWMVPSMDFTTIPKKLDHIFETFDKDGALRTMTLKTGDDWTRTRQENLLTKLITTKMSVNGKKEESNKAIDLLDALSRSGSLPVSSGELHVIIGVRHFFEQNVMSTVIQENVNPIEKVDYSSLLIAASVHQVSIPTLIANSAEPPTLVLKNSKFPPLMNGGGNDDYQEGEAKESGEGDL